MSSRIAWCLSLGLMFFFLSAPVSEARADLHDQRRLFLEAEDALTRGDSAKFNRLLPRLENYPLYPYLLFSEISRNIGLHRESDILDFLTEYECSPLSGRLRQSWLNHLAGRNQWHRLARDFRHPSPQSIHCAYARALLETGREEKAWVETEKLWLHGRSMPRQCDPVFEAWRAGGKLTAELVRHRIELAMSENQPRLARYLKRYLPDDEKPWVDLWLNLYNRPDMAFHTDWSRVDRRVADKILTQAMGLLIRKDTREAAAGFDKLKTVQDLSGLDTSTVEQEIALYLALRRHPDASARLEGLPEELLTPTLREWHVRTALLGRNWEKVLRTLDRLDPHQRVTPRWLYWKARALEALGRGAEASVYYGKISGGQNYFSVLAADRLGEPFRVNHRPISAKVEDIVQLRGQPGIQRALELHYLGRLIDARREWVFTLRGKPAPLMRAAAVIANEKGWHDRAIIAAANAGEFNDLELRFPLSHSELIERYAVKKGLDPVWVLALIRQESMFMADVGSPAGALGLMQIMPATGRRIASMLGERFPHAFVLLCPENNIRFGTYYLGIRWKELQNNPVLASAAYNAGVNRVRRWLPEEGSVPADIWIETIPFFETRNYIEMIFSYNSVYRQILDLEPAGISTIMPDVLSEEKSGP